MMDERSLALYNATKYLIPVAARVVLSKYGWYQSQDEIESVCRCALIAAVQKCSSGSEDSTFKRYAYMRMYGSAIDFLRKEDPRSRSAMRVKRRYDDAVDSFIKKNGKEPNSSELMVELGTDERGFAKICKSVRAASVLTLSMNAPNDDGDPVQYADTGLEDIRDTLEKADMIGVLTEAVKTLDDKKRQILTLFYFDGMTASEIGVKFGFSTARTYQLIYDAINQLKFRVKVA